MIFPWLAVLCHNGHSRSHNVEGMVVRICNLANVSPTAYVADLRQFAVAGDVIGTFPAVPAAAEFGARV
jgi:hypothetical protein